MPLKNQSAVKNILYFDRTFLFLLLPIAIIHA